MDNKKTEDKDFDFLENYKIIASILLAVVILVFMFSKTSLKFTISSVGDMGAIGDFFGGILNPIFALIGLFALLVTIKIQSKSLKISANELINSRKELELTRTELNKSAIAQQEQSNSLKQQNFENTFFKLISLHNDTINIILLEQLPKPQEGYSNPPYKILGERLHIKNNADCKGRKAVSQLAQILKSYLDQKKGEDINETYSNFYKEYSEIVGNYFNSIHQVLKFIQDNKKTGNIKETETYSELFNSQFLPSELELLFFHCSLSMNMQVDLTRKYIEDFSFFEKLYENENMKKEMITQYDRKAFGNNLKFTMFLK